jgi:hypothetical protein
MKFRIVDNAWWMFWASGMVLWPWVWFKKGGPTERLFRHELQHCYQVKRLGRLRFYVTYLFYSVRYGYRKNPFEVEAEKYEDKELTSQERAWMERGVVDLR